jgi:hypothetical protein
VTVGLWILLAGAVAWLLDRVLLAAEDRGWIYYRRRKAASGSLGGAIFAPAFDLLQPTRQIVVEQQEHDRIAPVSDEEAQRRRPDPQH